MYRCHCSCDVSLKSLLYDRPNLRSVCEDGVFLRVDEGKKRTSLIFSWENVAVEDLLLPISKIIRRLDRELNEPTTQTVVVIH